LAAPTCAGPVAARERDRGAQREMIGVERVEADGLGDGGLGLGVAVGVMEHAGVDVVGVGPVGREADGARGGGEGLGVFALIDLAEGEEREDDGVFRIGGEGLEEFAFGVGRARLREEELGAGEVGAHGGRKVES
jgi:hypothetical protein